MYHTGNRSKECLNTLFMDAEWDTALHPSKAFTQSYLNHRDLL